MIFLPSYYFCSRSIIFAKTASARNMLAEPNLSQLRPQPIAYMQQYDSPILLGIGFDWKNVRQALRQMIESVSPPKHQMMNWKLICIN